MIGVDGHRVVRSALGPRCWVVTSGGSGLGDTVWLGCAGSSSHALWLARRYLESLGVACETLEAQAVEGRVLASLVGCVQRGAQT